MISSRIKCHTLGLFCNKQGYYYSLFDRNKKVMHSNFISHSQNALEVIRQEVKGSSYNHVLIDAHYYYGEVVPAVRNLSQKKLYASLKWTAKDISPWGNDPIVYQYTQLAPHTNEDNHVLLYVSKKAYLEKLRKDFLSNGFLLSSISPLEQAIFTSISNYLENGINVVFYPSGDGVSALIANSYSITQYVTLPVTHVFSGFQELVNDPMRANVIATSWMSTINELIPDLQSCNVFVLEESSEVVNDFFISNGMASKVKFLLEPPFSNKASFPQYCLQGVF